MSKFLIALQYWDGDRDAAHELMELLAATVERKNPWADIVIYYRHDAQKPDHDTLERLNEAFDKVYVSHSRSAMQGYPDACNAMWADLATDAYRKSTESAYGEPPWKKYKALFSIEADCCPIASDWLETLSEEWDNAAVNVVGFWCNVTNNRYQKQIGHINGNMMFALDIVKKRPEIVGTPFGEAWDTWHAQSFKEAGWQHSGKMISLWNQPTITKAEFVNLKFSGYVFLHGIKDDSARKLYKP